MSDTATLSDLGLDSLMAADVKNILQTKFNITLANEQIKELKFNTIESLLETSWKELDRMVFLIDSLFDLCTISSIHICLLPGSI